jgi:hypothetical protein
MDIDFHQPIFAALIGFEHVVTPDGQFAGIKAGFPQCRKQRKEAVTFLKKSNQILLSLGAWPTGVPLIASSGGD